MLRLVTDGSSVSVANNQLELTVGADAFALPFHAAETIVAGGAGESFTFASGFGDVSLSGFLASGLKPDTLNFTLSDFDASWFSANMTQAQEAAALLSHATGSVNTVITDLAMDKLTLRGITPQTLAGDLGAFHFS